MGANALGDELFASRYFSGQTYIGYGPKKSPALLSVGLFSVRQWGRCLWCPFRESDPGPLPYQGSALPLSQMGKMEREKRLELSTYTLARYRSTN